MYMYMYMCGWLHQRWVSEGVAKWSKVGLDRANKIRLQVDMVSTLTAHPHVSSSSSMPLFHYTCMARETSSVCMLASGASFSGLELLTKTLHVPELRHFGMV